MSKVDYASSALNPSALTRADVAEFRELVEAARRHADFLSLYAEQLVEVSTQLARLTRGERSPLSVEVCEDFTRSHVQSIRKSNFGIVQVLRLLDDRLAGRRACVVATESFAAVER
jgi:hypothetical protein